MNDCGQAQFRADQFPAGYFDLVPQSAIRYSMFPDNDLPHNSIWDIARGPGNTMYASLCGELGASVSVRLYEYCPADGALRFCFDGGAETMANSRIIPPSKIHTSMQATRDGKLIMSTHTTARSPAHPYWMLDSYYTHMWEGYPGSHVIEWDPQRREAKVLGMPVARDTIYGAIYDDRHHALWFISYLKGHLLRLDLASKEVQDFGQITEYGSYCLCRDRLGHLYTASRSGHLFHVNVDTRQITDLGIPTHLPETNPLSKTQRILGHHAQGPDGRLYVSFRFSDYLYAIDPETLKIERTPSFVPSSFAGIPLVAQKGLAFDSRGVLWLVTMQAPAAAAGSLCHLHRWDLLHGGAPEYVGLLGRPERATACVSEMLMDESDVLHIADTNHGEDPPGVLAVDTRRLASAESRLRTRDAAAYLLFADGRQLCPDPDYERNVEKYRKVARDHEVASQFLLNKANTAIRARTTAVVRLWETLSRGAAAVVAMQWEDDERLMVWCGSDGACRLCIRGARVVDRTDGAADCPRRESRPALLTAAVLPSRQGRQYLAVPTCWAPWNGNRWLIGTLDGMVACFNPENGRTFSLGAVGVHGPVHQIVTDAARTSAFGVSGDRQDLGHVFHYDDQTGLREIGRTFFAPADDIVGSNTQPTAVALSPNGRKLAVGVVDALACVYLYTDVLVG